MSAWGLDTRWPNPVWKWLEMAARRLIIVLILLLAASVVAAAIAPDRTSQLVGVEPTDSEETTATSETTETTSTDETTTEETTTPQTEPAEAPEDADGARGQRLIRGIDASEKNPETVRAAVGDQLTLTIGSNPPRTVAILPFGQTDFAGDDAPASFNLLLRETGTFDVTDAQDTDIVLGQLEVRAP